MYNPTINQLYLRMYCCYIEFRLAAAFIVFISSAFAFERLDRADRPLLPSPALFGARFRVLGSEAPRDSAA